METLTTKVSLQNKMSQFLQEYHEAAVPNIKKNPELSCKYAFAFLFKKFCKEDKDLVYRDSVHTQRLMFPLFGVGNFGWLCLNQLGPYAMQLEYHTGGEPYFTAESHSVPSVSIWAGYWNGNTLGSDPKDFPGVQFFIDKVDCVMTQDFEDVKQINKVLTEMILLQEKFKSALL